MEYLGSIRTSQWFVDSMESIQSTFSTGRQSLDSVSSPTSVTTFDQRLSHVSDSFSSCVSEASSSISTAIDEIVKKGDDAITEIKRYMFINTSERQRIRHSRRVRYRQIYSNQVSQNQATNDHSHTTNHGMEKMARTVDNKRHKYDAKPNSLVEKCAISPSQSCPNVIPTLVLSSFDQMEQWHFDHDSSSSERIYDIVGKINVSIEYSVTSRELKVTIECVESNKEPQGKLQSMPMFVKVCYMQHNGRKQKRSKTMNGNKLLNCNEDFYFQNISFDSARLLCLRFRLCKKMSMLARKRYQYVGETFVWLKQNAVEQRVKLSKNLYML